ncbi:MAG: hypothetical protein AAFY26_09545 [Cyanobacteria bacterium J06638_22]
MTRLKAIRNRTREMIPTYWRQLIEVGVPLETARIIAWVIARYDAAHRLPSRAQADLLSQYCPLICRAGLWRSSLLLDAMP